MIVICARRSIKNFNPNIIIVSKTIIDELNRYKPQPTSRTILFLNVIKQKIPLMSPATTKIIVNAKLNCTIDD
jgi:hypothetical protein